MTNAEQELANILERWCHETPDRRFIVVLVEQDPTDDGYFRTSRTYRNVTAQGAVSILGAVLNDLEGNAT